MMTKMLMATDTIYIKNWWGEKPAMLETTKGHPITVKGQKRHDKYTIQQNGTIDPRGLWIITRHYTFASF